MKSRILILIIIISSIIILSLSLNAIYMASSMQTINDKSLSYDNYISAILIQYSINIIIPMVFSLYSIFELKKNKVSGIYIFMWMILNLSGAGYSFYGMIILNNMTAILYIIHVMILVFLSFNK